MVSARRARPALPLMRKGAKGPPSRPGSYPVNFGRLASDSGALVGTSGVSTGAEGRRNRLRSLRGCGRRGRRRQRGLDAQRRKFAGQKNPGRADGATGDDRTAPWSDFWDSEGVFVGRRRRGHRVKISGGSGRVNRLRRLPEPLSPRASPPPASRGSRRRVQSAFGAASDSSESERCRFRQSGKFSTRSLPVGPLGGAIRRRVNFGTALREAERAGHLGHQHGARAGSSATLSSGIRFILLRLRRLRGSPRHAGRRGSWLRRTAGTGRFRLRRPPRRRSARKVAARGCVGSRRRRSWRRRQARRSPWPTLVKTDPARGLPLARISLREICGRPPSRRERCVPATGPQDARSERRRSRCPSPLLPRPASR